MSEYSKKYYWKNREKLLNHQIEYQRKNRHKKKIYDHKFYLKNEERYKILHKNYILKNKEKLKRKSKSYLLNKRKELVKKLGGKCVKCGIGDIRVLQVDHINGGGNKERISFTPTQRRNMIMKDDGSKYQLLCANCNWIKGYEKNEFPCQKRIIN